MARAGAAAADGPATMKTLGRRLGRLLAWPLVGLVAVYRYVLSPLIGNNCRFQPSCSEYAREALLRHGAFRGGWLAARRVARCHPWGGSGHDPLPERRERRNGR